MRFVGIALWVVASVAAFLLAKMLPWRRRRRWIGELCVSVVAGLLFGVVATALDFGGWKELDWRAALFVLLGSLIAIAVTRLARAPQRVLH
jgi:uncharacterized membrane protein YeaQ/YmgE (transglycosylase-associated protein family)